ncbi:RidA family protein [Halomonas stenophila]|uniref:2-iminobutanoate/2-iminopropanoate deaminase n=1 Tax=Halomonas stenophila TaxID=795312 RepID=A0A7W5EXG3_9GAMM|nr:RidA family protein [Halomonas stenophila]MBB3232777.1 2-iminobutanoate/2-iminopropanoate deaminase [Halomonas stenophila]
MPKFHNDSTLPTPNFPGSHVVLDEDYVYLSGLTAADIQGGEAVLGDVAEETRWVMRRLVHILEQVDCRAQDAVRVDVHLTDIDLVEEMDAAYAEFFTAPDFPARTCTEAPRLLGGANVEITLVARRPPSPEAEDGD